MAYGPSQPFASPGCVTSSSSELRQRAGVHLELLDLVGQRLHLRLGQVDLGAIAAAEDAAGGEGDDAADQHDDDDDLDQAEAGLRGFAVNVLIERLREREGFIVSRWRW